MENSIIGRLYDIQGFSVHDGPGVRTTVFLKGCPLHCMWCHSPESIPYHYELSQFDVRCVGVEPCGLCLKACPHGALSVGEEVKGPEGNLIHRVVIDRTKCQVCFSCAQVCTAKALAPSGYEMTVDEVYARVMRDEPYFGSDGGVTISGGEPMEQFPFTLALAKKLKEAGVSVCLDTTGFAPLEHYLEILPYIDLLLYDLKHMDSARHKVLTGVPNELIHDNARKLAAAGARFQIRIPTIPKLNNSMENMEAAAKFCAELGDAVTMVQLLPYHSFGKSKYDRLGKPYKLVHVDPPSDEDMQVYLELMQRYGLPAEIH